MTRSTFIALSVLALSNTAIAQDACFTVGGEAQRSQHVVGLDTAVRASAGCEYAVTPQGPWVAAGPLAGRDTDFLELFSRASSGARVSGDPRVLLGRPTRTRRGAAPAQESLMLRYCAHYLLEEQLAFRVVPSAGGGTFRIQRAGGGCDGDHVELRAVEGAREERLSSAAASHTLGSAQRELELPEGDWSIYAARPGSAVGLRIGVFRSQRVVTPLANHLHRVGVEADEPPAGVPPLLAAAWEPGTGGMLLHPTDAALGEELLWPEVRTAADAGLLWLADARDESAPPRVIAPLQLEAGEPASVRLPDVPIREHMRAVNGDAGDALAPTPGDWRAIFSGLALCLAPSYRDARPAAIGAAVPDAGACASLGGLSIFAQTGEATPARLCIRHGMQVLTAEGARHEESETPECFALPDAASAERAPYRMAVAGDRIRVEGAGLCVLLDDRPLTPGEGGEIVLEGSGLREIRQGGGDGCTSRQSLARLRMPVIDPEHEWHPVGLYTGASESQLQCPGGEGTCPWRALAHDESDVFAFVDARQDLEFRLSTSPQVAAAINAGEAPVQVTESVPVLSGVSGSFEGARGSAVVAYVARTPSWEAPSCPSREGVTYADLRARTPLDVDTLMPDATFTVYLLSVAADDAPVECLARATFRARPSRAVGTLTVSDFLGMEVGLLGDTQLALFANDPIAIGIVLPLVWFRLTPGQRWVSFDVGGNLVAAAAFPGETIDTEGNPVRYGAQLSRLGVSLSWALTFGVPDYLPRFLSVGGMLHGAADTSSPGVEKPIVSFFVSINLASLVDLAGGR